MTTRCLLLAIAVLLAGCVDDADDGGGPTNTAATTAPPATDPPVEPSPATPATTATSTTDERDDTDEPGGVQPEGFTTVTVRITTAEGEVCEVCMWLADEGSERGRGLMGVTDLGEPVGMAFLFSEPVQGAFYMFGTPTPLSIAWFGPDGTFVSAADMPPCLSGNSTDCPRYGADDRYQLAIEVFEGDLPSLGLGPGATAVVLTDTEAETCQTATGA